MTEGEHEGTEPLAGPAGDEQPASVGNERPAYPPPPQYAPEPAVPDGTWSRRGPPPLPPGERVYAAWQRRAETDYIFDYWTALGWTILTFGIYSFYVFYQLVRRMRDHNVRRVELLDAALTCAWEEAGRRGLQDELTPSFQRADAHMAVLRGMTSDFREPVVWVVLAVLARGIVEIIAFVLLDQDLVKHEGSEFGVEYELSLIFGRFGYNLPAGDHAGVKGKNNYVGRIIATIVSFGIYLFWWYYNQMNDPNRHFQSNWLQEDELVAAVQQTLR